VVEKIFGATAVVALVKEAAAVEVVEMTIVVQIEAETVIGKSTIVDLVVVVAAEAVEAVDDGVRGTRICIS
jgi:hypothetical protein